MSGQYGPYETVEEIAEANAAAGKHFFEESTMRFFNSRVLDGVYGGHYFVTSEKDDFGGERAYTIRYADDEGDVSTVGEFQGFATREAAINTAMEFGR